MLDALDLISVATEFVNTVIKCILICMRAWLPWWMPRLHGACMGFKSPLGWYSNGFEDCDSLLNRLSLLKKVPIVGLCRN